MRGSWPLVVAALLLGGCSAPSGPATTASPGPDPLPEPRPHGESMGAHVVVPAPTNGTYDWKGECARQWSSGAYTFSDPPVVKGKPCLAFPTRHGTLHYTLVLSNDSRAMAVPAAPLARADGGFDWVALADRGRVVYIANGTVGGITIANLELRDPGRAVVAAVRLEDGTSHAFVFDSDSGVAATQAPEGGLHHAWWTGDPLAAQWERVRGGFPFDTPSIHSDGRSVVAVARGLDVSWIYEASKGPLAIHAFPGLNIFDADVQDGTIMACASSGTTYLLVETLEVAEPGLNGWTTSPIAAAPLAHFGFSCPTAIAGGEVTVIIDSPAPIGNGPNPLGGSVAFTRRGTEWEARPLGFQYHSGAGAIGHGGLVFHWGETANGTSSGDERNGTEVRAPLDPDPAKPWQLVWGNFGRTVQWVPDSTRLLIAGEMWANSPFQYPGTDGMVTWGVIELPLAEWVDERGRQRAVD